MTMVSIMVKKISGRAEYPPPVRSSQQNRAFSHFFVLHFPYMARDPTIFLVNFITFCALNKWSKFRKNGRCLNIFKTKKLHYLLHYPIVSIVKCMRLQCIFQKIQFGDPQFFFYQRVASMFLYQYEKFQNFGRCFKNWSLGVK